jgi:2-dehydro-3-deoxy-D-arabinonate dehydratase
VTSIVRYSTKGAPQCIAVGVLTEDTITPLPSVNSLSALLALPRNEIQQRLGQPSGQSVAPDQTILHAPVDGRTEVWAAGVTYEQSRSARTTESEHSADLYERVYDATRPELFFKSVSWKVRGHEQPIGIRGDSAINVPEPELAVVLNSRGETVGYTICNDVSSRSIEGENALYLPQAKVYAGACAIGPGIRPAWEVPDPYDLDIELSIAREGRRIWHGSAHTSQLHRRIDDLVEHLFRADFFPDGVVLSTGTCLVPELPFTLVQGDRVDIRIGDLGTLSNRVHVGIEQHASGRSPEEHSA